VDVRIDVSVVISTYNRCNLLPTALESVAAQQTGDVRYEVIVVDNNSTDHTRAVVESFIAGDDGQQPHIRYFFEPQQGLSYARNTGIANARGAIIAFTDDDVAVSPDWVAQIKRALDAHPEVDFVGGKVLPRWPQEPPAWLTREHWSPLAITDHGEQPFYINAAKQLCLVGASLAIRRIVFDRFGAFNPNFQRVKEGLGSTEDHEMQMRLWHDGRQGMYVPTIVVTAEVQAERLSKEYHRKWHRGHGKFCSIMRLRDIQGLDSNTFWELPDPVTLFGTPAFLYYELITSARHWATASARRREAQSFFYENQVRHFFNYIRQRYEDNAATRSRSALGEIGAFAKALLRKKSQKLFAGNGRA